MESSRWIEGCADSRVSVERGSDIFGAGVVCEGGGAECVDAVEVNLDPFACGCAGIFVADVDVEPAVGWRVWETAEVRVCGIVEGERLVRCTDLESSERGGEPIFVDPCGMDLVDFKDEIRGDLVEFFDGFVDRAVTGLEKTTY